MNKFDFVLCGIFFSIYLLFFWAMPLYVHDLFDNRWLNVVAFHAAIAGFMGIIAFIIYACGRSNRFYNL